jgi:hypothetical protein
MIRQDQREITSDRLAYGLFYRARKPKTRAGTTPFLKLSAKMVDLSLQHNQQDSLLVDIPAHVPEKSECPPEAKIQLPQASLATIIQNEAKEAAQVEHSGIVQGGLNLLRSGYRIRIQASPTWLSSLAMLALTLIAFSVVYGFFGYHQDSLKNHSQIPTATQQRERPALSTTSIASENTRNQGHTLARSKPKSRRRRDDYIAKDTYVYYGKDGKASH